MVELDLFGKEVDEILTKEEVKPTITSKTSTGNKGVRKPREPRKPKEPSAFDYKSEIEKSQARLKELEAQDETGWTDFDKSIKGKDVNMMLVKNHISYYKEHLNKLREPFNLTLNKWKEFIVNLCKERNQEIDKIWFNESAPYECEVEVRLAGHRCYSSCVGFRFDKGLLKAYDSGFGGGTSFLNCVNNEEIEAEIKRIMERVFNHDCDREHTAFYKLEDKPIEHRKIEIDEKGWII